MTNPYRAMCAELLAAIQLYTKLNPAASDMSPFELTEKLMDAMAATGAALAQPAAEEPTDEELYELWVQNGFEIDRFARAVLARWGRPKPPSEADQALALLNDCADRLDGAHENTIRRALEALPND